MQKKNNKNKQKKKQILNEYCKKEKDNEVYLNILYNKNYECNLKKPTTKEIELNNIYKNLKISDWFNPTTDINFVDVAQDGNCFFRSLSVLIYDNENNYKKIKYAVKNKIIEFLSGRGKIQKKFSHSNICLFKRGGPFQSSALNLYSCST